MKTKLLLLPILFLALPLKAGNLLKGATPEGTVYPDQASAQAACNSLLLSQCLAQKGLMAENEVAFSAKDRLKCEKPKGSRECTGYTATCKAKCNAKPVAAIVADKTSGLTYAGALTLSLDGRSSSVDSDSIDPRNPNGKFKSYAWTINGLPVASDSKEKGIFLHSYKAGSYRVALTVTDKFKATGSAFVDIVAKDPLPPSAQISASPVDGYSPLNVAFNGGGSTPSPDGGSITSYAWDFGDGSAGTKAQEAHTYTYSSTVNSLTARLTIKDSLGSTVTAAKSIVVRGCGDGIKNGPEECDGGAANGKICAVTAFSPFPAVAGGSNSCTYCDASCRSVTVTYPAVSKDCKPTSTGSADYLCNLTITCPAGKTLKSYKALWGTNCGAAFPQTPKDCGNVCVLGAASCTYQMAGPNACGDVCFGVVKQGNLSGYCGD